MMLQIPSNAYDDGHNVPEKWLSSDVQTCLQKVSTPAYLAQDVC